MSGHSIFQTKPLPSTFFSSPSHPHQTPKQPHTLRLDEGFHRWRRPARSSSESGGKGDDQPVDIDALAARLAAEAARLQSELGQVNFSAEDDDLADVPGSETSGMTDPSYATPPDPEDFVAPFGLETKAQEADILSAIGDGGFSASEFELLQELGQISIQQVEAPAEANPFAPSGSQRTARAAVIAYTASYFSGMPFQDPVVTLLKEYLPGAKAVACNELQILCHLCGMPGMESKWHTAYAPLSYNPPVVELLGYFLAGPSERALLADPSVQFSTNADTIWIVQKWESMAPLALYPSTQQTSGLGLGRLFGGNSSAQRDRFRMLRSIAAGAVRALGYVHDRGVIHGSIGSGSLLLSSFSDQDSARLVVKIDNFGFARRVVVPGSGQSKAGKAGSKGSDPLYPAPFPVSSEADDSPLALGQRGDRRQLAVVLLECMLGALSSTGPTDATSAETVQRVFGDVFEWDAEKYRQYVKDEPEWGAFAELLGADELAGWQLIQDMVSGKTSASTLLNESRFLQI